MSTRLHAAFAIAILSACGENKPCQACPALEGRYAMSYQADTLSCSAAFDVPPDLQLDIERTGSALRSSLFGVPLSGTLYDTYDFALTGLSVDSSREVPSSISIFGRYIPSMQADAGATLSGNYRGQHRWEDGGTQRCDTHRAFTGIKQP